MLDFERATAEQFLSLFPKDQMFRYFVDARKQSKGWKAFENNEPGYLNGMFYSLNYELMHLNEPLSTDLILRIHANALEGVRETNYDSKDDSRHDVFRSGEDGATFGLNLGKNLSEKGYKELVAFANSKDFKGVFNISETMVGQNKDVKTYRSECVADSPEKEAKKMVQLYNDKLKDIDSKKLKENESINLKMDALIDVICQLERLHPFSDANCRTFCMTLLYRECLKMGVMPPLLDDPNQFDGFSHGELKQKIYEGGKRAQELITKGKIKTHYRVGLFEPTSSGGEYSTPEMHKDLTQMDKLKLNDFPYPKWSELPENHIEDSFLYKMIMHESKDRMVAEFKESPITFTKQEEAEYQEEFKQFAKELTLRESDALMKYKEAIQFGCTHQMTKLLNDLKVSDISPKPYTQLLVEGVATAHQQSRKDITLNIMDSLNQSLENNINDSIYIETISALSKIDSDLADKCMLNTVLGAQKKGISVPEPVVNAACMIFAENQYRTFVTAKLKELENQTSVFQVGIRQAYRNSNVVSSLKKDLDKYSSLKTQVIQDCLAGRDKEVEKKITTIPKVNYTSGNGLTFSEHLDASFQLMKSKPKIDSGLGRN